MRLSSRHALWADQRNHDQDYRLHTRRVANLYQKTYGYDPVGNITAILDQQQAANDKHYEYDDLNRLTLATIGSQQREQFDYDAVGNRIAYQQVANGDVVQDQTYQYADTSNRLLNVQQGATQRAFRYDDAGNTVQDARFDGEQRTLQYGANNRLQAVAKDGLPTARYQHNAQGQRVIKVVNGEETHFIYDINDRLIAEADGTGRIQRQFVYLGREPIALQDAANDQWYFVHNDHLGTPKLVTDANAKVKWRGEAGAFGETVESGSLKFAFRFPGQVEDGESGYFYNYFRDYDSSTGRYLQSDPIGLEGGVNTFAYVSANPLNHIDILGLADSCGRGIYGKQVQDKLLQGAQDGHITLGEAKAWWQAGNGAPLTADMSKINFGTTSGADFPNGVGSSEYVNLFFKYTPDGAVYGNVKLTLTSPSTVKAALGFDTYDFDISWSDGRNARNVFTFGGKSYHGSGTPFRINLQGTGTLNP